jgi:hypothetical protein
MIPLVFRRYRRDSLFRQLSESLRMTMIPSLGDKSELHRLLESFHRQPVKLRFVPRRGNHSHSEGARDRRISSITAENEGNHPCPPETIFALFGEIPRG